MSKNSLKTELEALICYNEFAGECFDKDGNTLVICDRPDDSGCLCDNGNEEVFMRLSELYVDNSIYEVIQNFKAEYP